MATGLYTSLLQFLRDEQIGNHMDDPALAGLGDTHKEMVIEYAESEGKSLKWAREHLHLPPVGGSPS
jgi:hypothetical protein